ncbi:hypothetical protein CHUAL_011693 [Chamberlinius hualienensis]
MRSHRWKFIYGLLLLLIYINNCTCFALTNSKPTHVRVGGSITSSSDGSTESMSIGDRNEDSDEDEGSGHGHEDHDDDDDEDDDDVNRERRTGVVVAAVPVVLGLITVVLLCLLMIWQKNQRHKAKLSSREPELCLTRNGVGFRSSDSMGSTVNMACVEVYQMDEVSSGELSFEMDPAPPYPQPTCPSEEDLPPSYDEVMRTNVYLTNQTSGGSVT